MPITEAAVNRFEQVGNAQGVACIQPKYGGCKGGRESGIVGATQTKGDCSKTGVVDGRCTEADVVEIVGNDGSD